MNTPTNVRKIRKALTEKRDAFMIRWAHDGLTRDRKLSSEVMSKELNDIIRMAYDAGIHDGKNDG